MNTAAISNSNAVPNSNVVPVAPTHPAGARPNELPRPHEQTAADLFSSYPAPARPTVNLTISSFPFNQTALGETGRQKLDEIVTAANRMKSYSITIVGHADSQTLVESANWRVSQNRAQTAKDYLISQGLDPRRIYTEGAGATQPIASNDTPDGRAQNRRVEIKLVDTSKQ